MSATSGPGLSSTLGMLVASILVIAAMAITLLWFFRRLTRIQKEKWGDKADINDEGPRNAIRWLRRRMIRRHPDKE